MATIAPRTISLVKALEDVGQIRGANSAPEILDGYHDILRILPYRKNHVTAVSRVLDRVVQQDQEQAVKSGPVSGNAGGFIPERRVELKAAQFGQASHFRTDFSQHLPHVQSSQGHFRGVRIAAGK